MSSTHSKYLRYASKLLVVSSLLIVIVVQALAIFTSQAYAAYSTTLTNFNAADNQVVRFDVAGNAVDAHDGDLALFGSTYYLYGTSYNCGYQWGIAGAPFCGFKVYSSPDLVHWTDLGFLFDATTSTWQTRCNGNSYGCYRPHVVYNASTSLYVLWINSYDNISGFHVFTSAQPAGPFTQVADPTLAVNNGAPVGGLKNGDHDTFVDDNGTAYLAYTDWVTGGGIVVEQLNASYLSGAGSYVRVTTNATEAPALFKRSGIYYLTYSDPNCGYCTTGTSYRTTSSILGAWSAGTNISTNSCGGQPSFVAPIPLTTGTAYIYGSDLWNNGAKNEALANYYWVPLTFSGNAINPLVCQNSVALSLSTGSAGSQLPVTDLDQEAGVAGFRSWSDISSGLSRIQTFVPSRTGILTSASLTTFQIGAPNAGLTFDIVPVDASYQPTGAPLYTITIPTSAIGWSPRSVYIYPNVSVNAGSRYGILARSTTTSGAYGWTFNDNAPYPSGGSAYKTTGSWIIEANRTLKFLTTVSGGGPTATPTSTPGSGANLALGATITSSSSIETSDWGAAKIKDGQRNSVTGSMGWTSNNTPTVNHSEWLQLNMGASYSISRVDLYPRNDSPNVGYGFPIDFTIQVANDASCATWTTVITRTAYPLPGNAVQSFSFTAQSARCVKVNGTSLRANPNDPSPYRMQFAEAEIYSSGGGPTATPTRTPTPSAINRALASTVTSSSSAENTDWGMGKVKDGQRNTVAGSMGFTSNNTLNANHTEWLQLNMGASYSINRVDLYPRNDAVNTGYGFPIDFTIQVANDTSCATWTTVITRTAYALPSGTVQSFTFTAQSARCVKVNATSLRPNPNDLNLYRLQFAEAEIW